MKSPDGPRAPIDWLRGRDPWLPKVIVGMAIVVMAMALAALFMANDRSTLQGEAQAQTQLDS